MNWTEASPLDRRQIVESWLKKFSSALEEKRYAAAAGMFHSDGYWRDLLTFEWLFKVLHGSGEVEAWLRKAFDPKPARNFRLESDPTVGGIGEHPQTLEFFFRFETAIAFGRGYARLVPDPGSPAAAEAYTFLTTMQELKGYPEKRGKSRPRDDLRLTSTQTENWLDRRRAARQFKDRDPDVIVIGGGQSGLMMAARLGQLGVDTLVIEKTEHIGDVWRNRYHSLQLHNEICMNHFAYLPFPDTWPVFIPKDKLADWLAFYAEAMELNIWTKTKFLGGEYDSSERHWTVRLRTSDRGLRTMQPRHIVLAAGVSGLPNIPRFEGTNEFAGPILHSSSPTDELDVKGKSVLVVGAGTSGHDLAQSLHVRGANVTMLQRSSITVVSLYPSSVRPYELYRQNDGVKPIEDTDLIASSVPYPLFARLQRPQSHQMAEDDKELLDGLRKVGFMLDNGEDDTGYFLKLLRYQAGYYLNIGASDLIAAGSIRLKSGVDIKRLAPGKIIFSDESSLDADIILLATGYKPLQEAVRSMLSDAVADRVGPIWGIGKDGELNNMYAQTAQPGFYVTGGGLPGARAYSRYTALLIKADLEGLRSYRGSSLQTTHGSMERPEPEFAQP
ncbi:MAG: NAD(P)/FAD-dependent oxidoreductase [Xanthobacteraceae bacterium]